MRYYKQIENGYILAIGTGDGGDEISFDEYKSIMEIIRSAPKAESGHTYKLKDDLTWVLLQSEDEKTSDDESISGDEFLQMVEGVL